MTEDEVKYIWSLKPMTVPNNRLVIMPHEYITALGSIPSNITPTELYNRYIKQGVDIDQSPNLFWVDCQTNEALKQLLDTIKNNNWNSSMWDTFLLAIYPTLSEKFHIL